MTTSAIPDPRTAGAELEQNTVAIAQQMRAADVAIRDTAGLAQAVLDRQALGEAMKRVETYFAPLKKGAHDLHKLLCNRETDLLAPLREVDAAKRDAMTTYHEQEQRAREARERDLADARQRDEQTRAAVEAAALEDAGDHATAAAVLREAIAAPRPVVVLPDPTRAIAGLKFRRSWKWRYSGGPKVIAQTSPTLIARTLALLPREFLCADERKIQAYVTAMAETGKIPGIDIYAVDEPVR